MLINHIFVGRTWHRVLEAHSHRSSSCRPHRMWCSSWDRCSRYSKCSRSSRQQHSQPVLCLSYLARWWRLLPSLLWCSPQLRCTSRSSHLLGKCRAYLYVVIFFVLVIRINSLEYLAGFYSDMEIILRSIIFSRNWLSFARGRGGGGVS